MPSSAIRPHAVLVTIVLLARSGASVRPMCPSCLYRCGAVHAPAPQIVTDRPSRVHLVTRPAISAVAFCPHPPLLRPGIATGIEIETQSLRLACNAAVERLIDASPSQLLVLGADGPPSTGKASPLDWSTPTDTPCPYRFRSERGCSPGEA